MKNKLFNDFQKQIKGLIEIEKISQEVFNKKIDLSAFEFDVLSICSHHCYGNYDGSPKQSFGNLKRIISFLKSTGRQYYVTLTYKDDYERVFVEVFFYPTRPEFRHESLVTGFNIVYGTDTFGMDVKVTRGIEKYFYSEGEKIGTIFPGYFGSMGFCYSECRIRKVDLYKI